MSGSTICAASNIALPFIHGLKFQPAQVELVSGYATSLPGPGTWTGHDELNVDNLRFCNVSLTYTHDGHTEPVNTQVYLPIDDNWNGRLVGVGGGGWAAGLMDVAKREMAGSVSEGYVAVGTNGGGNPYKPSPQNWALHDDGTVNMYLLELFHSQALSDAASIGKAVTETFYGRGPDYSYWQGCSQGGRQGLMLAQRYPEAYNGILAVAPALNIPTFLIANYYSSLLMNHNGDFPQKCEFDALREAVIAECDSEDGISDGIISNPSTCLSFFDPYDLVNTTVSCPTPSGKRRISDTAAKVAKAAWTGPKMHNGSFMWYATYPDADLVSHLGQARTHCEDEECFASDPMGLTTAFMQYMLQPGVHPDTVTHLGLENLYLQTAKNRYDHIIATNNANLSAFRATGGKILSFHGLSDEIIPPGGTHKYYDEVLEHDPDARDFFRYFDAPGLAHCFGGKGAYPTQAFADLVAWVERGQAPETILARGPIDSKGESIQRPLCVYPLVARYRGTGDTNEPKNFYCAESYLSATPMKLLFGRIKKLLFAPLKTEVDL